MRRHRWLRRVVILAILVIVGMKILAPGDEAAGHTNNGGSGRTRDDVTADAESSDANNMRTAITVSVENEDEGKKGEETIVGLMIDRIAAGEVELSDENSIRQALSESEGALGISLTDDNKDRVVTFLQTLGTIGVGTEDFINQAKEKYQKYGTEFVEEANEAINEAVESAATSAAQNFFESIRQAVGDFFKNLIPG